MDNITQQALASTSCVIKLDSFQYAFYQQSCIELQGPQGQFLELIGRLIHRDMRETEIYRLREQLTLITTLLCKINNDVELPAQAVAALANMFQRAREFIEQNQ